MQSCTPPTDGYTTAADTRGNLVDKWDNITETVCCVSTDHFGMGYICSAEYIIQALMYNLHLVTKYEYELNV